MQNLLRAADAVRSYGRLGAPMGNGRYPLVDTRDVGAAAAAILAEPPDHTGRTYVLTGPAAHSYEEIATALASVAGRAVTYEPSPPDAHEARLLAAGVSDWRAHDLAHIAAAYGPGDNVVSPDVGALLGRAPRSLSDFLADHGEAFR